MFISSADWMPRNLDRRIELLVPVEDKACRKQLLKLLQARFRDNVKASILGPDGHYTRTVISGKDAFRSQEWLYRQACEEWQSAQQAKTTAFEPHRAPETAG